MSTKQVSESELIHQEHVYLDLLRKVLIGGEERQTRNATTLSCFGESMEFDIQHEFPLLSTKRMFWKGIVTELMWFLKAHTDSKELEAQKVNIWKGNSSREYLDTHNLGHYREGDCGPIYGFQWRNFGGTYRGPNHDYLKHGDGVDQLGNIVKEIKTNPSSRRLVMCAWNPSQEQEMVLPPCHTLYQFYVQDGKLSCQMYQRSGDLFLGVPFNIASTALLTSIVAKLTNLVPHKVRLVLGDAHIYKEHVEAVEEQLSRKCLPWCTLSISDREGVERPEDFVASDFVLNKYKAHKRIPAKMVV